MGTVGGLIDQREVGREQRLSVGLSASPRKRNAAVASRGHAAIGVTGGGLDDGHVGHGTTWSVAVCGVIDSVNGEYEPARPAEAIAQAFDSLGVKAAKRVTGDFNCIATDGERLIAFRDHIGTDGLFVGSDASSVAIMSEPKQVVAALGRRRVPDIDALVSGYFSQWEAEDDVPCPVSGVDRVPRGVVVEAKEGAWSRKFRAWDPTGSLETSALSEEQAGEAAWGHIVGAVNRAAGGPTAVSLSGGIDSTVIAAALASGEHGERIGAVSAVYPESVDETIYISETAAYLHLDSITYEAGREQLDDLETWVDRFDGPTHGLGVGAIDQLNDVAASAGYRTILSGEMAELVYDLREHAIGRMLLRGRLGPAVRNIRQLRERGLPWRSLTRLVGSTLTPRPIAVAYARRQPVDPPPSWLDPSFMPGLEKRWDLERAPSRRWQDIQAFFATGPSYPGLELSTMMGDLAQIRTRRPIVDRDLWEFFLTLPPEVKFPDAWTKSLVRHALDGRAPDSVVWRTDKTVFDEDMKRSTDYEGLMGRVNDGFELPGVRYQELRKRIQSKELTSFELSMLKGLASIHAFVAVA